jgi:Ca2+-binding RTX toxin-like protein
MEDTMDRLYFKDWQPPSGITLRDPWRDQYGTPGDDTLYGDWSGAPSFASKDDIGGLRIHAGDGEDKVYAGFGDDEVWGGDRNDELYGEGGTDTLNGEQGSDLLDGGSGADTMVGGVGNDTYVVDNIDDKVIEAVNDGFDGVESHLSEYTLPPHVENLFLKGSASDGHGNELDNRIFGNSADNRITGGGGRDTIDGGGGNDWIWAGTETTSGPFGHADELWGGTEADTFVWTSTSETSRTNPDMIGDFQPMLELDRIDLRSIDADETMAGNQNFTFAGQITSSGFTAPGQILFQQDTGSTFTLLLNTDSDWQHEAAIIVNITVTPDASWFL